MANDAALADAVLAERRVVTFTAYASEHSVGLEAAKAALAAFAEAHAAEVSVTFAVCGQLRDSAARGVRVVAAGERGAVEVSVRVLSFFRSAR